MPGILATVHLPFTTGLPEDEAVNTYSFNDESGGTQNTGDLTDLIIALYNDGTTPRISAMISEVVSRSSSACRVDLAEIVDEGPTVDVGPVYFSDTFTLGPANSGSSTTSLPLEVALVSSFYNSTETSVTIRRRRGRVYLGPLDYSVADTTGPYPVVDGSEITALAANFEAFAVACAANDTPWCVWSRTAGALYPVDTGFIDNEWDTQRRRGVDATSRTTWTTLV